MILCVCLLLKNVACLIFNVDLVRLEMFIKAALRVGWSGMEIEDWGRLIFVR